MLCHKLMDGLKNLNSNQLETQEVVPVWDPCESFYDRASLQKYRRPQNTCCVPTAMEASRVAIH